MIRKTIAPGLAGLSKGQREQAMTRWRLLAPHLDDGVPLARIAAHNGVGERTPQRWAARYRPSGLAGLAPGERADKGQRRMHAELRLMIEGLALKRPAPSIATIQLGGCDIGKYQVSLLLIFSGIRRSFGTMAQYPVHQQTDAEEAERAFRLQDHRRTRCAYITSRPNEHFRHRKRHKLVAAAREADR